MKRLTALLILLLINPSFSVNKVGYSHYSIIASSNYYYSSTPNSWGFKDFICYKDYSSLGVTPFSVDWFDVDIDCCEASGNNWVSLRINPYLFDYGCCGDDPGESFCPAPVALKGNLYSVKSACYNGRAYSEPDANEFTCECFGYHWDKGVTTGDRERRPSKFKCCDDSSDNWCDDEGCCVNGEFVPSIECKSASDCGSNHCGSLPGEDSTHWYEYSCVNNKCVKYDKGCSPNTAMGGKGCTECCSVSDCARPLNKYSYPNGVISGSWQCVKGWGSGYYRNKCAYREDVGNVNCNKPCSYGCNWWRGYSCGSDGYCRKKTWVYKYECRRKREDGCKRNKWYVFGDNCYLTPGIVPDYKCGSGYQCDIEELFIDSCGDGCPSGWETYSKTLVLRACGSIEQYKKGDLVNRVTCKPEIVTCRDGCLLRYGYSCLSPLITPYCVNRAGAYQVKCVKDDKQVINNYWGVKC